MIVESIILAVAVVISAFIINGIEDYKARSNKISFKEAMDLAELPIVTFYNEGAKFNFILDSGASLSVINSGIIDSFPHTKSDYSGTLFGMEGNKVDVSYVEASIKHKDTTYDEVFQVVDMSAPFGTLKEDFGVNVHGILGNSFFKKYKYILDFDELIAYHK
jgi:hypothetical protein